MPVAATMSVTRWLSSLGVVLYMPWALPIAGAKTSTPVALTKSIARLERLLVDPLVVGHVLDPLEALDLALDQRAVATGLGDDLDALALVLLDARACEPSNRTEFQPFSRHSLMTSRSGQWSRWSATGTLIERVMAHHIAYRTSAPIDFTVLTEVWTMSGALSSSAAARTASMRQVVDDVDRRDAVVLLECSIERSPW